MGGGFRMRLPVLVVWAATMFCAGNLSAADLSGLQELCKQGVAEQCRVLELRRQIDDDLFDGTHAKFLWVLGPRAVAAITPRDASDRRVQMQKAACTFYAEAWLGPIVAEYGRLTDMRIVDRTTYRVCMDRGDR